MAGKTFTRNRIRGISFHHSRGSSFTHQRGAHQKSRDALSSWTGPTTEEIRSSTPTPLTQADIQRLLHDHSRSEMHQLVSQSIENLISLQQLAHSLRKLAPNKELNRHFLERDELDNADGHPLQVTAIEIVSLQRIWKLRLELLEMIVMAQNSLRTFQPADLRKTPPRGVKSVHSKK